MGRERQKKEKKAGRLGRSLNVRRVFRGKNYRNRKNLRWGAGIKRH